MLIWIKKKLLSLYYRKDRYNESNNIVTSLAKAKPLYKELIRKSHPDKNPHKRELANELTELINNNRYNYQELMKLKERINKEL